MRSWSVRPLIVGSALLIIVFAVGVFSADVGKNKECAQHCLGGCKTRGPGRCDRHCKPSFSLQRWSGLCISKCGVGCLKCIRLKATTYHHCRRCKNGYKMRINKKTGETYCRGSPASSGCDPNCAGGCQAKKKGRCDTTCSPNYILTSVSTCAACDVNCLPVTPGDCKIPGTCMTTCKQNYALVTALLQCAACSQGCTGGCITNGAGFCDGGCSIQFVYDSGAKMCQPCDVNCASGCSDAGFCNGICNPGYGPTSLATPATNRCQKCADHCTSGCNMKGAGLCDSKCEPGWVLTPFFTCGQCQTGPYCKADVVCEGVGQCALGSCLVGSFHTNTLTCY